jgi:hypothetical protein
MKDYFVPTKPKRRTEAAIALEQAIAEAIYVYEKTVRRDCIGVAITRVDRSLQVEALTTARKP